MSVSEIAARVEQAGLDLDDLLRRFNAGQVNKQIRNKHGISIHQKLEDAKRDLDELAKTGVDVDAEQEELTRVARILLSEIFQIAYPPDPPLK
jgi:hypothetical protein